MEKSFHQGYSCRLLVPEYDLGYLNNSYNPLRKEITFVVDKLSLGNRRKEVFVRDSFKKGN
jgi:hypothetical protein